MNEENINADIAIFVETFENQKNSITFPKNNYNTFSKMRHTENHGGLKIVTKIQFQATEMDSISQEQLTIKLNFKDRDQTGLLITGIYLKP